MLLFQKHWLTLHSQSRDSDTIGVMLEWLKRHAWKACIRQKRIGGSNPPHSAPTSDCMIMQSLVLL